MVYPDGSIGNVERVLAVLDEAGDMKLKMVGDAGLFCKDYEYRCVRVQLVLSLHPSEPPQ